MEQDVTEVRVALAWAGENLEIALARVRAAQGVEWQSVFATQYRYELSEALRGIRGLAWALESLRTSAGFNPGPGGG